MIRIEGEIYVDVSDYDSDLRVSVDNPSDMYDLMIENNITEQEMLEYFSDSNTHTHESVIEWLKEGDNADVAVLTDIIRTCAELMLRYWNEQHTARIELAGQLREIKQTVGDNPAVHMTN